MIKNNEKLANLMFDRTWKYLADLAKFHLAYPYENKEIDKDNFEGFVFHILKTFQNILKLALENNDIINFKLFLNELSDLFEDYHRPYSQSALNNIWIDISNQKKELYFGLSSWIFNLLKQDATKRLELLEFYNELQQKLPQDINQFTQIFINSYEFESRWGWENWGITGKKVGFIIPISNMLCDFYIINSLNLLKSQNIPELPADSVLAALSEPNSGTLIRILNDIEANPQNWNFIIDNNAYAKITTLKDLLKKVKEKQEKQDLERKRELNISQEQVNKFKDNLIHAFNNSTALRNILIFYNLYKDKTRIIKDSYKLGFNTVDDKAIFFGKEADWHISYIGIDGSSYGQGMADGENKTMIDKIKEKSTLIQEKQLESILSTFTNLSNIIIIATNNATWEFFQQKNFASYKPKWLSEFPNTYLTYKEIEKEIEGVYIFNEHAIPVYQIFTRENTSDIIILDKTKFCNLTQYSPLNTEEDLILQKHIFYINIQSFSENALLLQKFLDNPPAWLQEIGTNEQQYDYLKERVLIEIYEKFNFELNSNFQGYYFKSTETNDI